MQNADRANGRETGRWRRMALYAGSAALVVATIAPAAASAEVFDPLKGYAFDGSPVGGQRGREAVQEAAQAQGRRTPQIVSANHIRRVAEREGFQLSTVPHRRGRSYFAMAENQAGHRVELIFNAFSGYIVGQRDFGPLAVAKTADKATAKPLPVATVPSAGQAPAPVEQAAAAAPTDDSVAAAKAEVAKAAAAEADAKRLAEARAADSRRAQVKLADAEAAARHLAEAKALEARRREAALVEQRRADARAAEAKRQALATAEAKLAEARTIQARADVELKKAEAAAAAARAAAAPADMKDAAQKPAELAPVAKAMDRDAPASEAHASDPNNSGMDKTQTAVSPTEVGNNASAGETTSVSKASPAAGIAAEPAEASAPPKPDVAAASDEAGTDRAPTGSTSQDGPPEPYAAPTPADGAAETH